MSATISVLAVEVTPMIRGDEMRLVTELPPTGWRSSETGDPATLVLTIWAELGRGHDYLKAYWPALPQQSQVVEVSGVYVEEKSDHDELVAILKVQPPTSLHGISNLPVTFKSPHGQGLNYAQAHFGGAQIKYLPSAEPRRWVIAPPLVANMA